jgi:aspartate--ammonia ligase
MLKRVVIPHGYQSILNYRETEIAIKLIKDSFEKELSNKLTLIRVSAPLFVMEGKGINDNLSGSERVVAFEALDIKNNKLEIVQSLAKWKRIALAKYKFTIGNGLYTDMNAIRRDESLDNLHSIYVDQWDWEKVLQKEERTLKRLQEEVKKIYEALKATEIFIHNQNPQLQPILPKDIFFITTQELEDLYPALSPKEREDSICREHGAVFLMKIGGKLRSGIKHDDRSPDYDDWELNGDLLIWYPILERALEISSMGIRVDKKSLLKQLKLSNMLERKNLEYHQAILSGILPYTIGGGIGQSRLCMFLLKKVHIGEVQVSEWNEQTIRECFQNNIPLL